MDTDPARAPGVITAATTLGEIAHLVADRPALPVGERLAVETVTRDEVTSELAIADGVRARRMPYLATAATCTAGYAAWGAAELAAAVGPAGAHGAVVAGTWAATAAALPVLRIWWRNRIPDAWRSRWWLSGAAAAAWVDVAAATTPATWPMMGALAIGSAVLSARWLAEHEVPNPGARPLPALPAPAPPPAIETSRAAQIERRFYERAVTGRNAVARGAKLTDRTDLPNGTRWTIELDPDGSVNSSDLQRQGERVARALVEPESHVILEPGRTAAHATLTVVTHDLLADGVPYEGPDYHDGRVKVGMYADGTGWPEWIAWERGQGVRNGLASGEMGSGKTALLELVALGLRSSGCWRVWWGDGDPEGSSSPLMMDSGAAHWAEYGAERLLQQLAAFEALLNARAKIKHLLTADPETGLPVKRTRQSQPGLREFVPCPDYPAYMWFLPEFFTICEDPLLTEKNFVRRFETALRRARKFGLGAAVDTQSALGGDFKGSTTLRSFLQSRNAFVMRTTNRSEQHVVNGLTVSPGMLPEGGGYGFVPGRGRAPMMRTCWAPDLHKWVPSLPECHDDPDAALVIAPFLPAPAVEGASLLVEKQAEVEQWRAALRRGDRPAAASADQGQPRRPVSVGGVSFPAPLGVSNVIPMHPRPGDRPAAAPMIQPGELSTKAAQVLAALRSRPGPWRSAELIEVTGLPGPAVSKALDELRRGSLAHRPTGVQGVHAAGPAPAQQAESAP